MRAQLSSLGVVGTAALLLPLLPTTPLTAHAAHADPAPGWERQSAGSTRSLPLEALDERRGRGARGLPARSVAPFSLVGVVWDDADAELNGRVQVRTRARNQSEWSGWRTLHAHHGVSSAERAAEAGGRQTPGATAPLWTGPADGVQVRVQPRAATPRTGGETAALRSAHLPEGLRVQLVDPGHEPAKSRPGGNDAAGERGTAARAGAGEVLPTLNRSRTNAAYPRSHGRIGPRPKIVTRQGWGADEQIRESGHAYTGTVKAAFVHHTVTGNDYSCGQVPSILRGIYRYHVESLKWRDIGYNFFVDKCGTLYEGRAGGVAKNVQGAHTYGFNENSTGIAVLGTFTDTEPAAEAVRALGALTAWRLGVDAVDAGGTSTLVSGGGNRFPKGEKVALRAISGHRDGYNTECPGEKLYAKLGGVRAASSKLQGR